MVICGEALIIETLKHASYSALNGSILVSIWDIAGEVSFFQGINNMLDMPECASYDVY
jgi:hypothetical protein